MATAAEFIEFYKNGMAAVESQRWSTAAEMMQKAIDQQPQAKTKVKKALYFRRYIPHFYLGMALYETGNCSGALRAWQKSEAQGVVQRFPEAQQIQEGRLACGQMVGLQSALNRALRAVESAENSGTQARRRLSELSGSEESVQLLVGRQAEAEASLMRVRQRLASNDIVLESVEEAAALAAVAKTEFEAIRQQADEMRVTQVAARQQEQESQILGQMATARRELQASEYLKPYPAMIARRRAAVVQALEHAQAASDTSLSGGELQAIQAELTKATRELRRSTIPPPTELATAAEAFLAKDYRGVVALLGKSEFSSPKASYHSHLLQAAAFFALYYSSGASDSNLLERARQQVLACLGDDPGQSPPPVVFSPSFVAFFESQTLESTDSTNREGMDEGT